MRVISISLSNFASYKELDFRFEDQGLTLLQGPTGSGKSTLCDATPWVLFGTTAKGGAVDEVRSWNSEEPTRGHIAIEVQNGIILHVTRIRGTNAKDNDLFYSTDISDLHRRGRDLNDTQKLINNLLGVDSALYLSGAYFHEFSQTAQFFITTAKNRRAICEQLVDLSLPKKLQLRLAEERKVLDKKNTEYASKIQLYADRIQQLQRPNDYQQKYDNFEKDKQKSILNINTQIKQLNANIKPAKYFFDIKKDLIEAKALLGTDKCSECGAKKHSEEHEQVTKAQYELHNETLQNESNVKQLQQLKAQLNTIVSSENTFAELLNDIAGDLVSAENHLVEYVSKQEDVEIELADMDLLADVVNDMRSLSIKNTIKSLEEHTNQLLTDHFDAEIRVDFEVADADKLDVTIYKDGNQCSYHQLSKGQRGLLKLCFGVSVMHQVSNHNGISFNAIFFDEALDGLSDTLKLKAYGLFATLGLSYKNIFVVEHSEALKAHFEKSISVRLENGNSILEKST